MALFPGKYVKLVNKKTGALFVYEVNQIIYGDHILGVACITNEGITDFYFKDYQMLPMHKEEFYGSKY